MDFSTGQKWFKQLEDNKQNDEDQAYFFHFILGDMPPTFPLGRSNKMVSCREKGPCTILYVTFSE